MPNENETNSPPEIAAQSGTDQKQVAGTDGASRASKKSLALPIGIAVIAMILIVTVVFWLRSRGFEDTDDAQIDGHLHPVASRVEGTVIGIGAEDDQPVTEGQLLVVLDPRDYQVATDQAKAAYDQALAQVSAQHPNIPITNLTSSTSISVGKTEVAAARAALAGSQSDEASVQAQLTQAEANSVKAQNDLQRYTLLLSRNEVSQQDYDQYLATAKAEAANVDQFKARLVSANETIDQRQSQLKEQQARLGQSQQNAPRQIAIQQAGVRSSSANAESAKAKLIQAQLNLGYTRIYSPVNGIVIQRSAETGAKVSVGQQLMMVVETGDLWVTANFRETQLRHMQVGQHVVIHVDTLGRDFKGRIQYMPAASGDRTSVLPPENATGNYVKIVQRLPVRICFEAGQAGLEYLRPGMSVEPKVDVR